MKNKKNLRGVTLIEAIVSIVIIGVGIASVLNLSAYLTRSADYSIESNKINFVSEMIVESALSTDSSIIQNIFSMNLNGCNFDSKNNFQKIWVDTIINTIDSNVNDTTRCLEKDIKEVKIKRNGLDVLVNFSTNNNQRKKNLGFSKIE